MPQGKNLVGAFKQPAAVIADLDTLATLPAADWSAGWADFIKAGLMGDPELFHRLEQHPWPSQHENDQASAEDLLWIISRAVEVKRAIVEADPFEAGQRALLNLGHTFAHAIERVTQFQESHGRAVGLGLVAATRLSLALGHCPGALAGRVEALVRRAGLPIRLSPPCQPEAIVAAMASDKKRSGHTLRFVLIRDIGDVFVSALSSDDAVLEVLRGMLREE
jgi:3-dehydroquinate synthetase